MAAFNGTIFLSLIYSSTPTNEFIGNKPITIDVTAGDTSTFFHGSQTDTQPVTDEAQRSLTGQLAPAFGGLEWFDRIHIQYRVLDLGAVVSAQTAPIEIFSTYLVNRSFEAVAASNDDGLTLITGELPLTFAPWQSRTITLIAETDGPPNIAAEYVFTFDVGDYQLSVNGRRVIPWWPPPNWTNGITERLEFRTDVLRRYDGSEQRLALRADGAQWSWEFSYLVTGKARRILENAMHTWNGRVWALPIWPQGQALLELVNPGATVLQLASTADLDFYVGGLAFIQDLNQPEVYESVQIESIEPTSITTVRPIGRSWAAGTVVYPARPARMTDATRSQRFTGRDIYGQVQFRCEEQLVRPALSETLYRGLPVMERKPNWVEDPSIQYARDLATIDLGIALPYIDDRSELSEPVTSFRETFTSRAEIEAYRRWLFARRGRQRALWLPTWSDDIIVVTEVAAAANAIEVENCEIANYVNAEINRRDIRIQTADGQVRYRRITSVLQLSPTVERIVIDTPLGTTYQPADFVQISWMALSRLDADAIELAHWSGEVASTAVTMRAPRTTA